MVKSCGLCAYVTSDPADFDAHMRREHHWDQVGRSRPDNTRNTLLIVFVIVMTPLLVIPTVAGGLGTPFGVLAFLVMFGFVLRSRGPRVLLSALGAIAVLYAGVFIFGLILAFLIGG